MNATLGAREPADARRHRGSGRGAVLQLALGTPDQVRRFHVEGVGQDEQGAQRRRVFAALQEADVGRVQVACRPKCFLGELSRLPGVPQDAPKRLVQPLGAAYRSLGHGSDCCGLARAYSTEYVLSFRGRAWREDRKGATGSLT